MQTFRNFDIWLERTCQLAAVALSLVVAFLLRFDLALPAGAAPIVRQALFVAVIIKLPVFELSGFYRALRRFAGIPDLYLVFLGNVAGTVLFIAVSTFCIGPSMPRSVLLIDAVLCFLATALVHFSARIFEETFRGRSIRERTGILIYGAGAAGAELVREIRSNQCSNYEVKGFLDDDPSKQHASILGIPVLGPGRQATSILRRLNHCEQSVGEIILALPSASGLQMREALANCRAARIPCKTVPGIDELLSGRVLCAQVRNPSLQDLLGRQQVRLDDAHLQRSITGRSVIVTGAAGSIGSELCRQLARLRPGRLVAFDQAESDLFRIENELREKHPDLELIPALGSIRELDRISGVLRQHQIESVFHAAAYKHVPMMESHAAEAVRNNVLGTWNLVRAARDQNVERLLMISSDKAVNPVCVMGATKRVCERIVSARQPGGHTRCVSVRFGNVLGTNGSVVPIFQEQIAAGGPVKVTHPEARRYFMTIAEAVSLVLQASSRSEDSEIFILDMGEPVRIVDLAENMIRLAGKVPYDEIDIEFTGLRPGEKLIEELRGSGDRLIANVGEKLSVLHEPSLAWDVVERWIAELKALISAGRDSLLIAHLQELVPEYRPGPCARAPIEVLAGSGANGHLLVS
jgi:FlaA1/EpsC-like NDP-sugar epimerase